MLPNSFPANMYSADGWILLIASNLHIVIMYIVFIQEMANELVECAGKLYAVKGDVSKEDDIVSAFCWVEKNFGGVDILINSASTTAIAPIIGR